MRDFGALHTRLVPGFVLDTKLDGEARIVSFANGTVARELLVDCDEARRRLVYAVISERMKQHSASVQVIADGEASCRLIWIVDVLPHEIAPYIDGQMDQAALAMQKALGTASAAGANVIFLTEASTRPSLAFVGCVRFAPPSAELRTRGTDHDGCGQGHLPGGRGAAAVYPDERAGEGPIRRLWRRRRWCAAAT